MQVVFKAIVFSTLFHVLPKIFYEASMRSDQVLLKDRRLWCKRCADRIPTGRFFPPRKTIGFTLRCIGD